MSGYIFLIISITVLSRDILGYRRIELVPFVSFFHIYTKVERYQSIIICIILNVLMFIPVGAWFYMLFKSPKITLCARGCFLISFSIEIVQLIYNVGEFEIDDIIHNIISGLIGYLICRFAFKYFIALKGKHKYEKHVE